MDMKLASFINDSIAKVLGMSSDCLYKKQLTFFNLRIDVPEPNVYVTNTKCRNIVNLWN